MVYNVSLKEANTIIKDLEFEFKQDLKVFIEVFSNGIEQGYCLKTTNDKGGLQCNIALSRETVREKRVLVVYFGKMIWFNRKTNTPKESKDWLRRKFFESRNECIDFVLDYLEDRLNTRTGLLKG